MGLGASELEGSRRSRSSEKETGKGGVNRVGLGVSELESSNGR